MDSPSEHKDYMQFLKVSTRIREALVPQKKVLFKNSLCSENFHRRPSLQIDILVSMRKCLSLLVMSQQKSQGQTIHDFRMFFKVHCMQQIMGESYNNGISFAGKIMMLLVDRRMMIIINLSSNC